MAKRKINRKQEFQDALNEIDEIKAFDMRRLMELNFNINCKFKNKKQKDLAETIKNNRITFVVGSPGSGKTFIALKTALELIKDKNSNIGDIMLTTPIIEVSPKSIGALPGDLHEKTVNFFDHLYSNLEKIVDKSTVLFLKKSGLVNDKIINFIRGNTFGRYDENGNAIGTYCLLDEAQNLTVKEMKTFISRLGENSKMVIAGDPEQCDLKLNRNEKNGLVDAIERFKDMKGVGIIEFNEDDIVRDPFLIEIMKKYK
jgi:phosphate starvation-inducible protein PhoH and related proteins